MTTPTTYQPLFEVAFCPTSHLLTDRWLGRLRPDQLPAHYADLLVMAQHHHDCRFWLLDLRGYDWHTPALGPWFDREVALPLDAEFGCPVFIAYLLNTADYSRAAACATPSLLRRCAGHQVYPYFFDNNTTAHAWLHHQQALDVELCSNQAA